MHHMCVKLLCNRVGIDIAQKYQQLCGKYLTPERVYKTRNFPQKMLKKQLTNQKGYDIISKLSAKKRKDVEKSIKKSFEKLSKKS